MKINKSLFTHMGVAEGDKMEVIPFPSQPHTSFLFGGEYKPEMAVPTDAVRIYYGFSKSWSEKGYSSHIMIHSRIEEDSKSCPDGFQIDRYGNYWGVASYYLDGSLVHVDVGCLTPELKEKMKELHGDAVTLQGIDHYKVPTRERTEFIKNHYGATVDGGVDGIGFDEPEFWAATGYCEAFKREWVDYYGSPWQPPHSSVTARHMADQLKAHLFVRHIEEILSDAKERDPSAVRLLSAHSPIGYYDMGIVAAHHRLLSIPAVQEMLAEVWNQPFDRSYLEYSSCYNLIRGTGKRLWFFMDPLGDSPDLPMEFYTRRFSENLLSTVMFPEVDCFEVLAWPQRIFGKVAKEYETVINTVTGALSELWQYKDSRLDAGSEGIGTFIADSMAWQREEPCKSDFDKFFGMTLPLVNKGIPVQVLSLDRVVEPDYLNGFKTLLLSYDFLKPMNPVINKKLAEWVRRGGSLICFGGNDAYNELLDAWWKKAGYSSPLEELFSQLFLPENKMRLDRIPGSSAFVNIGKANPEAWEAKADSGSVIYAGIVPGALTDNAEAAEWIRNLAEYTFTKAGEVYREQPYFCIHRGPYTAVWAFENDYAAPGCFVDLLSPALNVISNLTVPSNSGAFLKRIDETGDIPRVLAVSGRLHAFYERPDVTSFIVCAPSGTNGVSRIWTAGKVIDSLEAIDALGNQVVLNFEENDGTILFSYGNHAEGISVRIRWK